MQLATLLRCVTGGISTRTVTALLMDLVLVFKKDMGVSGGRDAKFCVSTGCPFIRLRSCCPKNYKSSGPNTLLSEQFFDFVKNLFDAPPNVVFFHAQQTCNLGITLVFVVTQAQHQSVIVRQGKLIAEHLPFFNDYCRQCAITRMPVKQNVDKTIPILINDLLIGRF